MALIIGLELEELDLEGQDEAHGDLGEWTGT